ncbi:hypothetical protein HDU96_003897 [Phlyctochytrium bullatum]|nr:hypothetical protein HDU96_003897 [Phlyctochytrium bullatum]
MTGLDGFDLGIGDLPELASDTVCFSDGTPLFSFDASTRGAQGQESAPQAAHATTTSASLHWNSLSAGKPFKADSQRPFPLQARTDPFFGLGGLQPAFGSDSFSDLLSTDLALDPASWGHFGFNGTATAATGPAISSGITEPVGLDSIYYDSGNRDVVELHAMPQSKPTIPTAFRIGGASAAPSPMSATVPAPSPSIITSSPYSTSTAIASTTLPLVQSPSNDQVTFSSLTSALSSPHMSRTSASMTESPLFDEMMQTFTAMPTTAVPKRAPVAPSAPSSVAPPEPPPLGAVLGTLADLAQHHPFSSPSTFIQTASWCLYPHQPGLTASPGSGLHVNSIPSTALPVDAASASGTTGNPIVTGSSISMAQLAHMPYKDIFLSASPKGPDPPSSAPPPQRGLPDLKNSPTRGGSGLGLPPRVARRVASTIPVVRPPVASRPLRPASLPLPTGNIGLAATMDAAEQPSVTAVASAGTKRKERPGVAEEGDLRSRNTVRRLQEAKGPEKDARPQSRVESTAMDDRQAGDEAGMSRDDALGEHGATAKTVPAGQPVHDTPPSSLSSSEHPFQSLAQQPLPHPRPAVPPRPEEATEGTSPSVLSYSLNLPKDSVRERCTCRGCRRELALLVLHGKPDAIAASLHVSDVLCVACCGGEGSEGGTSAGQDQSQGTAGEDGRGEDEGGSSPAPSRTFLEAASIPALHTRGRKKRASQQGSERPFRCDACGHCLGFGGVRAIVKRLPGENGVAERRKVGVRPGMETRGENTKGSRRGGDAEEEAGRMGPWIEPDFGVEVVCADCVKDFDFCSNCGGGGTWRTGKWRPRQLFQEGRRTCNLSHVRFGDKIQVQIVTYECPLRPLSLAGNPTLPPSPNPSGIFLEDWDPKPRVCGDILGHVPHYVLPRPALSEVKRRRMNGPELLKKLVGDVTELSVEIYRSTINVPNVMRVVPGLWKWEMTEERRKSAIGEVRMMVTGGWHPRSNPAPEEDVRRYFAVAYIPKPTSRRQRRTQTQDGEAPRSGSGSQDREARPVFSTMETDLLPEEVSAKFRPGNSETNPPINPTKRGPRKGTKRGSQTDAGSVRNAAQDAEEGSELPEAAELVPVGFACVQWFVTRRHVQLAHCHVMGKEGRGMQTMHDKLHKAIFRRIEEDIKIGQAAVAHIPKSLPWQPCAVPIFMPPLHIWAQARRALNGHCSTQLGNWPRLGMLPLEPYLIKFYPFGLEPSGPLSEMPPATALSALPSPDLNAAWGDGQPTDVRMRSASASALQRRPTPSHQLSTRPGMATSHSPPPFFEIDPSIVNISRRLFDPLFSPLDWFTHHFDLYLMKFDDSPWGRLSRANISNADASLPAHGRQSKRPLPREVF